MNVFPVLANVLVEVSDGGEDFLAFCAVGHFESGEGYLASVAYGYCYCHVIPPLGGFSLVCSMPTCSRRLS